LGTRIDYPAGSNPAGLAMADLDGDGRPDILVGNSGGSSLGIYQNVIPFGGPPSISSQPANQSTAVGGTASFSVTAGGTLPLAFQWSVNGTNINGATNTFLALTNVQLSQAGNYAVLVTNIAGILSSSNALLTVNPFPTNIPIILSFAPKSGVPGVSVMINGTNFSAMATNDIVYFGAVTAAVTSASPTNLVVTVPTGATFAPITVTVYGLTAYSPSPFMPEFLSAGSLSTASFAGPTNLTTDSGPYRVAVGDLDGDGKADVVVLNVGTIDIYRNLSTNGLLATASFAPPVVLTVQGGSANNLLGMTLSDLDRDGRLDIVVACNGLNKVAVFQNLSSPGSLTTNSFGAEVDYADAGYPYSVAVVDVDGDGKPDIITANNTSNTVSILQNLSPGGLLTTNSFATPVNFATASAPDWVAVADFDGDGKPDIVTANHDSTYMVSVLRNTSVVGTCSFAPAANLPELSGNGESVAVGDLDGDGKADIVVGSYGGQSISVYQNTSTVGSLTTNSFASAVVFGAGASVHAVAVADLDGDGKPDLALVSAGGLSLFKNTSTPGSFSNSSLGTRIDYPAGSNPAGLAMADLDGDGRPDILVGNSGGSSLGIYRNTIPLGFAPQVTLQPTNLLVLVSGTATFSSAASGTTPLAYQWLFNGTNLVRATNSTLVVTNVQPGNAGTYALLVTNTYGLALSSNAVLSVIGFPPVITNQPVGERITVGCSATFGVGVSGTTPFNYQWWKASAVISGQTNSSLVLPNVQTNDFAGYFVTISNVEGSTTSSVAVLSQNHPPVAGQDFVQQQAGFVAIQVATLLASDSDPDGDPITFVGISSNSAAGGTVTWGGNYVFYLPPAGYTNSDAFNYYISDGFCGGVSTGYVLLQVMTANGPSYNFKVASQVDGSVKLTFAGVPGWTYRIQYATALSPANWTDLSTNTADGSGMYQYIDHQATNSPTRYYRSVSP
ncbi:MAG TPA: FG-GAP-like repeat-containing protein, partial [Candidatus Sulfotelmatobacter sp.]|nr:FG-GAP-like repeat-containing protein [Candidatus Sulfotelmatobacter sp.]